MASDEELLQNMHKFDLLRLDRISNMFSLEVRHPFLKREFVEYVLSLHPKLKRPAFYAPDKPPISKYLLRKAFEEAVYNKEIIDNPHIWKEHNCLCHSLTNFEMRLKYYIERNLMTEEEFNQHLEILLNETGINKNTLPRNVEEMYYRLSFRKKYPNRDYIVDIFWDDICKT
jgi:asparagine synthase (glutamine-hydrolysing)